MGALFTVAGALRTMALTAMALLLTTASAWGTLEDRDPTWSGDGIFVSPFFGQGRSGGQDIAIDSEGRILVTLGSGYGTAYDQPSRYAGVMRLLPDGSPDPTFGNGEPMTGDDGVATYNGISRPTRIAVDSQDRVLLAGTMLTSTGDDANLVRFTESGQLDNSFDSNGSLGLGQVDPTALEVRPNGRILLTLVPWDNSPSMIRQLTSSGARDGSFGTNGDVTPFPNADRSPIDDLAIRTDGKVVVLGRVDDPDGSEPFLIRLNSNGTLDQAGTAFLPLGVWGAVAVDTSDRPVVTGFSYDENDETLLRYTTGGQADQSFGGDGMVAVDTTARSNERPSDVLIDPSGRILMAGNAAYACPFLARFTAAGALDSSFSGDGASLDCDDSVGPGRRLAMDSSGRPLMSAQGRGDGPDAYASIVIRYRPFDTAPPPGGGGGGGSGSGGSGGVGGTVATNIRNVHVHRLVIPRSLGKLARVGVWALASCDEDCRIVVEVKVSQRAAEALGLTGTLLARGSGFADGGERRWVRARFNAAVRRALRAFDGEARLQVNVTGVVP